MVVVEEEEAAVGVDFLEWLGPDTSAIVFTLLRDPADLANASAVSRSWRTLVMAVHLSKIQCLRACPEVSSFTRIEQVITSANCSNYGINEDAGANAAAAASALENHKRDHRVYMHLAHALLSPYTSKDCIARCIGASSTDNFPQERIQNTLEPRDHVHMMPSYWSSGGQSNPSVPECLVYRLCSDLCLIDEIKIRPFKAFFQHDHPIYSAQYVRFRMGCPKSPLQPEDLVSDENEGQLTADDNYIWTYTSPEFPMLQENVLQTFKLPRSVLCIGGVVKIELLGRIQKQEEDGLYYICVSHVQMLGNPLSRELGVTPCENGLVLKYYLDPESSRDDGRSRSKWHSFEARFWQALTGQIIGLNEELLSRLLGPPLQFVTEEDDESEEGTCPLP
ncbi:F-box protein At4g00755-like [Phragmites australis]|uniref:F-box protein At4g00755-like n=1 Tax=Phragmites australis TaxID=29695 RepID=UPI002D77D78E|nr:F-box protein At4g00755-like [Phragmites australis]XP_062192544.1 F-box protein At4g00755-like [Phragmites australis]